MKDVKEKLKKWGSCYLLLFLVLFIFGLIAPSKIELFIKEGVIWLIYMGLITLTKVTKTKVYLGYLVAVTLTIFVILMEK